MIKKLIHAVTGVLLLASAAQSGWAGTATLPSWVGSTATHNWKPRLGGVYWLDSRAVVKQAAPYLNQSTRPVLIDIKSDATGFGYRFDQNSWDRQEATVSSDGFSFNGTDAGTPASPEDALQIFGATSNAQFIVNIPIPLYLTNNYSSGWGYDGFGYTWQTPAFYAAWVQYLTGTAGPQSEWQNLPTTMDFSSQPASFNWADLRARRGHVNPYPIVAFIVGEEPYNLEGTPTGALYGPQAEKFRAAIRARDYTGPLGLHVPMRGIVDDPTGGWFYPMMNSLNASDFSYIDLEHYYQFTTVPQDFKRTYPVSINPSGFQGWWFPQSQWKSDYTKFMWIAQDTRNAIRDDSTVPGLGDPSRWNLGFSEHGIETISQFADNDMASAMHWGNWLAESMRQNITWDSGWTFLGEGFATAQLQVRNGYVTRTPMFFVYQMAQEFYGLDYLTNSFISPMGSTTDGQGNAIQYPWTVVRTFRDPANGNIHLFVVNQSTNNTATITGFENWNVISWKQLHAASYTNSNPLGVAGPEPIQTVAVDLPPPGSSLVIPPISVNHIILSGSGVTNSPDTTPPSVSITSPANGATVSGSTASISASASDNVGVTAVQFKLDGANLGIEEITSPYNLLLDSTAIANGAHTVTAVARDAAGNQATATSVTINVTNTVATLGLPVVTVVASVPTAIIGTTDYAAFTFTRAGDNSAALTVNFTLGGTAVKWDDYYRYGVGDMPVSIVIPAGASSYTMQIVARGNENNANPETASITLSADPNYTVGTFSSAIITMVSNAVATLPTVTVAATDASASRIGLDPGTFTLTRTGDTSSALMVNYSLGGTAANGTDYNSLGTSLTIPADAASATLTVTPKSSANFVGAETAVLTLAASSTYTVGSANNATVTIAGNSVPSTIGNAPGHAMKIIWSSVVGKIYRVACKNNLSDTAWTNLSGLITATGTSTSYTDSTANNKTQRYYVVYVTN